MLSEVQTELHHEERTVSRKKTNDTRTVEIPVENSKNVRPWVFVQTMEGDNFDEQIRDTSAFDWMPVTFAVCRLGTDRYPDIYLSFHYTKK